ncbi:hypothetical protein T10_5013 [Trichinella papuae]|uniref:Uncharacterized protein n=1 Tax=Trichinella papuae TaxID=268474 RepID=A0A0V1N3D4_9BILA|nr:hypothetical protein T10_5013 [Trichinella papuae]
MSSSKRERDRKVTRIAVTRGTVPHCSLLCFAQQSQQPWRSTAWQKWKKQPCTQVWKSCLEWPVSRLFQNHKQISPDQVERQVLPLWNGALQISGYTWADLS